MTTDHFAARLRALVAGDPIATVLVDVMTEPTGLSSAGYPYLEREAWQLMRDTVPHVLGAGLQTLRSAAVVVAAAEKLDDEEAIENVRQAFRVVRQVVFTATITAPPELWLLRHVLGAFAELGLLTRLRRGEAIYPEACEADGVPLDPNELETDLHFLLAEGIVEQYDDSFRLAGHPTVLEVADDMAPIDPGVPAGVSRLWRRAFAGEQLDRDERAIVVSLGESVVARQETEQTHWVPTHAEIELGYRLVPVVLGMNAGDVELTMGESFVAEELLPSAPEIAESAISILAAAAWVESTPEGRWTLTQTGNRGLQRGAGAFGIIEAYHPYVASCVSILKGESTDVWVRRAKNVGASQSANAKTFRQANDALDAFCADTGFEYSVFIEHAIGRGEATRQRFERSGDKPIRYFGADLEDAAIDAALAEQARGELPPGMVFVRNADIGEPEVLIRALEVEGVDPHGAVMLVGNGFHEVRDQSDEKMVEVFRKYHDAGIILVFTEENALSIDDLRATAFNTYHAGFKYVHEKSGQGLRPAHPRPKPRLGKPLRAPWSVCADEAGYVRAHEYCSRTRTIYPYTPRSGHNPSISVSHFVVPRDIADGLTFERGENGGVGD